MKSYIVILTAMLVSACGSTDTASVAKHKEEIAKCMAENPNNKEICVSDESSNRVGLVCKNVTVTGSRLPERVCTTQAQREERSKNSKMMVDAMQRRPQTSSSQ